MAYTEPHVVWNVVISVILAMFHVCPYAKIELIVFSIADNENISLFIVSVLPPPHTHTHTQKKNEVREGRKRKKCEA